MNALCVIPARIGSTRLPGKPLLEIKGIPLVVWVYRRAADSGAFSRICVATDDAQILDTVTRFGGEAIMTRADHPRGTDRVFEVVQKVPCSHVVNLQGDEPEFPIDVLRDFSNALSDLDDNTLLTAASHATISEKDNPNVVKVVLGAKNEALYFSRAPIPYERDEKTGNFLKHNGIYGFTAGGIQKFCGLPQGDLERRESLEQLRALEYGMRIRCIVRDFESIGIDTPEDLERFRTRVEQSA